MVLTQNFISQPSETILEIILEGNYNPNVISPLWLFQKKVLGEEEAKQINEKSYIEDTERSFSTKFIDIKINKEKVQMGIINIKYYDLLLDFAFGLSKEIIGSMSNRFEFNILCHYSLPTKNDRKELYYKMINKEYWKNILDDITFTNVQVSRIFENSFYIKMMTIAVTGCTKPNINNPYHLFIYNKFNVNTEKGVFENVFTHELLIKTLNESILNINKFIKIK